jgi:hypothetical protein
MPKGREGASIALGGQDLYQAREEGERTILGILILILILGKGGRRR